MYICIIFVVSIYRLKIMVSYVKIKKYYCMNLKKVIYSQNMMLLSCFDLLLIVSEELLCFELMLCNIYLFIVYVGNK